MAKNKIKTKVKATLKPIKGTGTLASAFNKAPDAFNTVTQPAQQNSNYITPQTDLKKVSYSSGWDAPNLTEIKPYQESQLVQDARNRLNPYLNGENRPTYSSQYSDIIKSMADKIANREAFNYDFNSDPLYQNYRDQYQRQAVLGQQGAMANAAALTGGYGSSYAATAGNLAYQENMSQLNNMIPQLYQMAYDKYNTDLSNQRADLSMYQDLENTDYGRYRDSMSDWNTDRGFYADQYNNEYSKDYGQYRDNVADVQHNDQMRYQNYTDGKNYTSAEHWNKTNFDYQKQRDKVADKQWEKEFKLAKKARTSGGSGGGGYRGSGSGSSSHLSRSQAGIYNVIAKYKNGNKPQGEIAWNTINRLSKQYNLTESQKQYLYYDYLGYKSAPSNKTRGNSGEIKDNAKKNPLQTWDDVPAKYQNKVMTAAQFATYCQSNASTATKKYKNNYQTYLKKMAKKYGF